MPRAPLPENELQRLESLRQCNILDTPAEPAFDHLTKLAAQLCNVPIALVSLIDSERQWFKSSVGLCIRQTDRDSAFCAYAILADEPLIIPDASADPRTSDNALVMGEPFIRFYAGIPLRGADGLAVGTLCVIDMKPREISAEQIAGLGSLAHQAEMLLEQRKTKRLQGESLSQTVQRRFYVRRWAAAIFLLGMVLTALAAWNSRASIRTQARERFERLTDRLMRETARRANQIVYGLHGARGVFAADTSVSRDQFARYVASRDLPNEFPGATGLGFIQRVPGGDAKTFVAAQRADGAPEFAIHAATSTARNDYLYVVSYLNPIEQNRDLLGFDAGSDPRWRTAIQQCIETGNSQITECYDLARDGRSCAAYTYFVPVYKPGSVHNTPAQRETQLIGVLFAPIVVNDVLASITDEARGLLALQIFDVDRSGTATKIFDGDATADRPSHARANTTDRRFLFEGEFSLPICEHDWKLRVATTAKFEQGLDQSGPVIIALSGTLLSTLLAALVWSLGSAKARAIALANNMTAGLQMATDRAERTARELNAKSIALTIQRGRLELALGGGGIGTWDWNPQTGELNFDHRWSTIIGEDLGAVTFDDWKRRVHPEDVEDAQACVDRHFQGKAPIFESAHRVRHKDGSWTWLRSRGLVVSRDASGNPVRVVGITENINSQKQAEEQLRLSATHDKLTGLPNRALLHDRLQQCILRAQRSPERLFAVLFLDFDRFKLINDTLGHEAGDDLLRMIAQRLRASLRPADSVSFNENFSMASRLGGDEFVVILDEIASAEDAQLVADRLLQTFAAPYRIGQHEVISSASIGIVTSNPAYKRADEMLRDADTAMYEAKLAGKGRYVVFDVAMRERVEGHVRIENDLRAALEARQFSLVYQPIVSLQHGEVAGMEALIRWNHPQRGLILPADFIPIAEESGQILPIGQWVLKEACTQFMKWQQTLGEAAPPNISVNLSRTQLALANLPETIKTILAECGMEPARLHLEVTETAVMRDAAASARMLQAVKDVGVKLEMDDFGTGHSSLACLHQFPIDVLKIDQSFITNIDRGRDFAALVQAIVQLARNLDIEVVAEGIETGEQAMFLGSLDCSYGQGLLFGKPLNADEVPAFMAQPLTIQDLKIGAGRSEVAA